MEGQKFKTLAKNRNWMGQNGICQSEIRKEPVRNRKEI
jgi:hypothetical protein